MESIMELAGHYPGVAVTVPVAELERFGSTLVEKAIERYKNELEAKAIAEKEERLLTAREAAKLFGVCVKTVSRWRQAGYIEPVPVGGLFKYRLSDCQRILEEGRSR